MSTTTHHRSYDVTCPYCGAEQDICHDDGAGYREDKREEQECAACDKTFVFTTSVSFFHEASKADCLNGGNHKLKKVMHYPPLYPDWVRCDDCDFDLRGDMTNTNEKPAPPASKSDVTKSRS